MAGRLKLLDIKFPKEYMDGFLGPKFGWKVYVICWGFMIVLS
jgi:ribulose 1,5-bisphosphate carboxylase large subunit-like protein